ncbi:MULTISPECIES: hypothetical protein [Corynebacterium]|uniref:hypothetical protein n=1 Tax=Corynebacterium TaxID=1716 RepID=UPI000BAA7F96|nr:MULTISPECIES: hypothetical protein [Corynebacterium]PAT10626.1 hypothetical protein CKJ83_11310 [Corynebacterium hadale]
MTTIETALSLSALVTVAAAIVAGIATIAAYITAVDTAGAAARAHAIGVEFAPPRGSVDVAEAGGVVTVTARVPAAVGQMQATALFPVEHIAGER